MSDKTFPTNAVDYYIISEFIRRLSSTKESMQNALQLTALLIPFEEHLKQLNEALDTMESIKKEIDNEHIPN